MIHAAAAIAAYHSKARESGKVSVCYTKVRCVGKEPKAKAGTVVISHETILKVAPTLPDGQNA